MFLKIKDSFKAFCLCILDNMILFISKIPIICSLTSFAYKTHKDAFIKWLILVIASSAPIIIAALLSHPINEDDSPWLDTLMKIKAFLYSEEQFVYSASFLAPTIFLMFEAWCAKKEKPGKDFDIYKGYLWAFGISVIIFLLTAISFTHEKTKNAYFIGTNLFHIIEDYTFFIYFFSLYALYLSIAHDLNKNSYYSENLREQEIETTIKLHERVGG